MRYEADVPMLFESTFETAGCREALADLPAALDTGNHLIDDEHRLLLSIMRDLRRVCIDPAGLETCRGCSSSRQASCEKDVVSLLGDLFAFILEHFSSEERIMRDAMMQVTDRELCDAHVEDHAAIAQKVQEIVSRLDREQTVRRIRELDTLLARWIENHIGLHDLMLVRWLNSDPGLVKDSPAN